LEGQTRANVHAASKNGYTPLHLALDAHGRLKLVRYLVDVAGADIDAVNSMGYTALHIACASSGKLHVSTYLVEEQQADLEVKMAMVALPCILLAGEVIHDLVFRVAHSYLVYNCRIIH
jgi:hypothetical protein